MLERCFVETLEILLAHRRERAVMEAGGIQAEVLRRHAIARSAAAAAAIEEAEAAMAVDAARRRLVSA